MLVKTGELTGAKLGFGRRFKLYWKFGKPKGGSQLEPPELSGAEVPARAASGEAKAARND
jgi:hypothetical protein